MKTIKNIVVGTITNVALAAACIVGMGIGGTLWENGLKDKFEEKTSKWFSKE